MTPATEVVERSSAQLELWHHAFGYVKSMVLKSALDLGIAEAIDHHGGVATLSQIATHVALHPSKVPCLRRLMRLLSVTGIFTVVEHPSDGGGDQHVYGLTPASRLLVGSSNNLAPYLALTLDSVSVSSFFGLGEWLQREEPDSLFEATHGRKPWDMAERNPKFNDLFHDGMAVDSSFIMDVAVTECAAVFRGLGSLIDVAGGLGGAAQAVANAFPDVACTVLDLPHVIANSAPPATNNVKYVAGDMFESIPPANATLLKWVLHDWGDDECVKILKNCKKAIPPRDAGGKVIIIDMVVGAGSSSHVKHKETQVLFDLLMMVINGTERDEREWKKIIFEAGFSDYKIIPLTGVRSIIEAYP
ncbi:hypothetical protein PR202_gb16997 [Eleusine coracana subsp. coracana]|uniref:O-methyltransferase ZRP4 n=1 Tax=Eleusine coracana subsp. coracana TaxID=191504 RepID=A0AAV5EZJ1_ELECO|nr:hypothetical protein QOZ80_6BG0472260 [Eleusine coracana subsp. coracana]GJN28828.1 hypothetical protein PR202_gb16997 [Eleusine coracana subsp. coracana]